MGQVYSYVFRKKFRVNEKIEGLVRTSCKHKDGESALQIFQSLGLSNEDIDLLYTCFWDIDADSSGLIRPIELFHYFEVEGNKFEWGVFTLFDEGKTHLKRMSITSKNQPNDFSFHRCYKWIWYDKFYGVYPTATGKITFTEVKEVLEMVHGKRIDKDPNLLGVYQRVRKEVDNLLTLQQFNDWTAANPYVTAPIMMLQLHIRLQIIGEDFWVKQALQRSEHREQGRLDYVKSLQLEVIARNAAFREKLRLEEEEKRRLSRLAKGKIMDYRDNVTRKQSLVMGFFRLKAISFHSLSNNILSARRRRVKTLMRVTPITSAQEERTGNDQQAQQPQSSTSSPSHGESAGTSSHKNNNTANASSVNTAPPVYTGGSGGGSVSRDKAGANYKVVVARKSRSSHYSKPKLVRRERANKDNINIANNNHHSHKSQKGHSSNSPTSGTHHSSKKNKKPVVDTGSGSKKRKEGSSDEKDNEEEAAAAALMIDEEEVLDLSVKKKPSSDDYNVYHQHHHHHQK